MTERSLASGNARRCRWAPCGALGGVAARFPPAMNHSGHGRTKPDGGFSERDRRGDAADGRRMAPIGGASLAIPLGYRITCQAGLVPPSTSFFAAAQTGCPAQGRAHRFSYGSSRAGIALAGSRARRVGHRRRAAVRVRTFLRRRSSHAPWAREWVGRISPLHDLTAEQLARGDRGSALLPRSSETGFESPTTSMSDDTRSRSIS